MSKDAVIEERGVGSKPAKPRRKKKGRVTASSHAQSSPPTPASSIPAIRPVTDPDAMTVRGRIPELDRQIEHVLRNSPIARGSQSIADEEQPDTAGQQNVESKPSASNSEESLTETDRLVQNVLEKKPGSQPAIEAAS